MTVDIITEDKRLLQARSVIEEHGAKFNRVVLLPIPSTKDGNLVSGTSTTLSSVLEGLEEGDAVVGYGLSEDALELAGANGAYVYDAVRDEEFLLKNADLTAIGVLGEITKAKDKAPKDVRFGIIGYGRIGKALLKYLTFLGASPTVFTTRESVRLALGEWGVHVEMRDSFSDLFSVEVLINTAPARITDKVGALSLDAAGITVFDLASGENFGGAESVIRLKGVPGAAYPISAGRAYAECFLASLSERNF